MITCKWCQQFLLLENSCPCRNHLVWNANDSIAQAKKITASNHEYAAEQFVDRYEDDPEDGEEFEVMVKNHQGVIMKVTVTAEITIDLCSSSAVLVDEDLEETAS